MVSQPEAPDYRIREAAEADLPALKRALAWAIEWRSPALSASPEHVISSTGHEYILAGWGREGDTAVVAQCASEPIGAAWYRFWNPELHSYGYIDSSTPEIGIAVEPRWRRRGVGKALIEALADVASRAGIARLCLSVESDNPALFLYEKSGFVRLGLVEDSWTMVRTLEIGSLHRR